MWLRVAVIALVIGIMPVLSGLLASKTLAATDIVVGTNGYACDETGLKGAIDEAGDFSDGGTVTFACPVDTTIRLTSAISINFNVTVDGRNGGSLITVSGNEVTGIFSLIGANLNLSNIVLRDANVGSVAGGAISNFSSTVTLTNVHFISNSSDLAGGAISNLGGGSVAIIGSSFEQNTAAFGGAIVNYGQSEIQIDGSTFSGNQATGSEVNNAFGGAIANLEGATAIVRNSRFESNQAIKDQGAGVGGAISSAGTLIVTHASFVDNHASSRSGAVTNSANMTTISDSTFLHNMAPVGSAVGIGGETKIYWSTIIQPANTGALLASYETLAYTALTLDGVILAGEGQHCSFGPMLAFIDNYTLSNDASCQLIGDGSSMSVDDLGLGDPSTLAVDGVNQSYIPLYSGSPAIDVATSACATTLSEEVDPATDQLGNLRPADPSCDVGAVEGMITVVDPVDLCANRWSGELRRPPYGRCGNTETIIHIDIDSPATLCANRWTGEARFARYDRCRSTELVFQADGSNTIPVCINRWTGELRVSSHCHSTERSDQL